MQNRNKMKKSNGAKAYARIGIFLFVTLFIGISYFLYCCICYMSDNGLPQELNFGTALKSAEYITAPTFSVPLNFATFAEILTLQVTKLWWVYLGTALIIWMSATGNYGNDYKGVEKGSAEWADKYAQKDFSDDTGIPLGNRFYASIEGKKGAYKPHNLNEIVIGGSGAGKSFRKIKPDIIQMFGSFVVTDPKGELYRDTAKLLKNRGYAVRVLNLINIRFSDSYNPFVYMREEQDVLSVADLFMKNY